MLKFALQTTSLYFIVHLTMSLCVYYISSHLIWLAEYRAIASHSVCKCIIVDPTLAVHHYIN